MSERAPYIVFEGSDGTGKSTQAIEVTKRLQSLGYDPLVAFNDETGKLEPIQEPGGTDDANILRRIIKNAEYERTPWENVQWFTLARKLIWRDAILPALEAGRPVVAARSYISTIAYQGYGEGIPVGKILEYTKEQIGEDYMTPNLLCILALQNEQVRKDRLSTRGTDTSLDAFESMDESFQANMQNGYVRYANDNGLEVIDASRSQQEVFEDLWSRVRATL